MFACKQCGRKFKTAQSLGGHVRSAHWQASEGNDPAEGEAGPEEAQQTQSAPSAKAPSAKAPSAKAPSAKAPSAKAPSTEEEPGVMDRIRALMRKGRSPRQIKEQFGYSPRTVDQVAEELIEPDAVPEDEKHDGFPMTRKSGSGQEVLNPEVLLRQYLDQDGDSSPGHWMFQGMMLLRAAQLMNMDMMNMRKADAEADAKRLQPLMNMIQVSRAEMDAAAQRSRESQEQVAHQAAGEAAAMAAHKIDERFDQMQEKKKDIAETADPMKGLMARTMEQVINQITGQMFGGGQGGQAGTGMPPGWEDKTKEPLPGAGGK